MSSFARCAFHVLTLLVLVDMAIAGRPVLSTRPGPSRVWYDWARGVATSREGIPSHRLMNVVSLSEAQDDNECQIDGCDIRPECHPPESISCPGGSCNDGACVQEYCDIVVEDVQGSVINMNGYYRYAGNSTSEGAVGTGLYIRDDDAEMHLRYSYTAMGESAPYFGNWQFWEQLAFNDTRRSDYPDAEIMHGYCIDRSDRPQAITGSCYFKIEGVWEFKFRTILNCNGTTRGTSPWKPLG